MLNENLLMKIEELELPIRSAVCLRNEKDIFYVGDLVQKTKKDLLKIPNFGKKSLFWVERTLAEVGLNLGMTTLPEVVKWPPECIKREIWRLEEDKLELAASKIFVEELKKRISIIEQKIYNNYKLGSTKHSSSELHTYNENLLNQNLIEMRTILQSVNSLSLQEIRDLIRMKKNALERISEVIKEASRKNYNGS